MVRRPKTPSEDFNVGYEVGWTGRAKQRDIEFDKLKALAALLEVRCSQAAVRAEAAEKRLVKAEGKRARSRPVR